MNKVEGKISAKGSGIGIPGLLVVVYDLDPETEPQEPPDAFGSLSTAALTPNMGADCLGSTFTDKDGLFELTYEDTAFRIRTPNEERPDLWLMALAPESPGRDPESRLIYASSTVRQDAGEKEYFLIDIPESRLREAGIPVPEEREMSPEESDASHCVTDARPAPSKEGRESPEIPDHTLLRPIGKGSYGEVWLATNIFGHLRAVKIVDATTFSEDGSYRRELSGLLHFEPVSRSHPGFVQVFHVGRKDASRYFYYVMELADSIENSHAEGTHLLLRQAGLLRQLHTAVKKAPPQGHADSLQISFCQARGPTDDKGPFDCYETAESYKPYTLSSFFRNRPPLTIDECLALALWLSHALNHLHRHGLIHRDIKPSNIVFVKGIPKFADVGLVTKTGSRRSYVGTEGYVPPEGPGNVEADVYALGKVMYEALTGNDRTQFPEFPPSRHDPSSGEQKRLTGLNDIILKAADHEVTRRYQSAAELYYDLLKLVQGSGPGGKD